MWYILILLKNTAINNTKNKLNQKEKRNDQFSTDYNNFWQNINANLCLPLDSKFMLYFEADWADLEAF